MFLHQSRRFQVICLILLTSYSGYADWIKIGTICDTTGWETNYSANDVKIFAEDIEVEVGETCDILPFVGQFCACKCVMVEEPAPPYLEATITLAPTTQRNVAVSCSTVTPAICRFAVSGDTCICLQETKYFDLECTEYPYIDDDTVTIESSVTYYFSAIFNPDVFVVNGKRESPLYIGEGAGSVNVTLVNDDCETLQKALESEVVLYKQKYQKMVSPDSCHKWCYDGIEVLSYEGEPTFFKAKLSDPEEFWSIGVEFIDDPFDCRSCPRPGSPKACPIITGNGTGGPGQCNTAACGKNGPGGLWTANVSNASVDVGFDMSSTTSTSGSPGIVDGTINDPTDTICTIDGTPEINAPGTWVRATRYPYQNANIEYDVTESIGGDTIESVSYSFEVEMSEGKTYYYSCELEGSWEDILEDPADPSSALVESKEYQAKNAFQDAFFGKIPLLEVKNSDGIKILDYTYDDDFNLTQQTSYDGDGDPDGIIKYNYEDGSLVRVWAGSPLDAENCYEEYPTPPTGGRWVDLAYSTAGADNKSYLDSIIYADCDSCRSSVSYQKGGAGGDLPTKVMEADQTTVLASYTYDNRGRYTSYSLGDNDLKVNEWEYSNFDPASPVSTSGDNMLLRRDYVTNTQYRATVFFADDNGAIIKEVRYHNVQEDSDGWLQGPYSVFRYYHEYHDEEGTENDWKRYVKEYPKGNKLYEYYDYEDGNDNGNVIKVQWEDPSNPGGEPEAEYVYFDYYYGDKTTDPNMYNPRIETETNAFGGETDYTYDTSDARNLLTRTEPTPGAGISGTGMQVVGYEYDDNGRVVYEYKKDSSGENVYTGYIYDAFGNIKELHEDCTHVTGQYPADGLTTTYDYNVYNELITTTYPSGRVDGKFYSNGGTVIAEAVYKDYQNKIAVSATIYLYEDGKLMHIKTAKMNDPFSFTDTVVQDEGEGHNITWVQESYEYDDYGRKVAVITDSGSGGQALRTEYEYNNQNEVIKVLRPDMRYTKTIRDGRGLVSQEITGVEISETENDKAITQYFYDLNGNLIKKIGPADYAEPQAGVTELYQYDYKNRMIRSRKGR